MDVLAENTVLTSPFSSQTGLKAQCFSPVYHLGVLGYNRPPMACIISLGETRERPCGLENVARSSNDIGVRSDFTFDRTIPLRC